MKTSRLLIFLFFFFGKHMLSFAQSDTITYYFDENLNLCEQKKAVITGKGIDHDGKFKFIAKYTKTNIPLFHGEFLDSTLTYKEGLFTYFNDAGRKESEGAFENNVETGYWLIWSGGELSDSILYANGKKLEHIAFSHDNGQLATRVFINSRKNSSETIEWYTREPVRTIKSITSTEGTSGEELKYYPTGKLESVTLFESGKTKSQKFYKEDGTEMTKEEVSKNKKSPQEYATAAEAATRRIPTYPGGDNSFFDFFQRNFKAPKSLRNNGQTVTVTFSLDKAGFAKDIRVSGSSDRDVEIEVMAVFRRMSAWNMNGFPAFGPITYTLNLSGY